MAYLRSESVMINEAFVNSGDSAVRSADVIICIININIKFASPVLDPKFFQISRGSRLIHASTAVATCSNTLFDLRTEL